MTLAKAISFVAAIIASAIANNEKEAVSELTHSLYGDQQKRRLAKRISSGDDTEVRLNGAGYKLYINDRQIHIGGDQAALYPKTTAQIRMMINQLQGSNDTLGTRHSLA